MHRMILMTAMMIAIPALPSLAVADSCSGNERLDVIWTTPDTRFIDNQNGTVTDGVTGLSWMRCPVGQTWSGEACDGAVATFDWQQALVEADGADFAGFTDWRLPNIKELSSIVEQRCGQPAQNATLFPAAAGGHVFWTASPYAGDIGNASYAWTVDFRNGVDIIRTRSDPLSVRLVRTVPPPQP